MASALWTSLRGIPTSDNLSLEDVVRRHTCGKLSASRRCTLPCVLLFFSAAVSIDIPERSACGAPEALRAQQATVSAQGFSGNSQTPLAALIETGYLSDLRWPNFSRYRSCLTEFYEPTGYVLAWVHRGQPTQQAFEAIEVFRDAGSKGLNADDYDGPLWADRIRKLRQSDLSRNDAGPARFDLALTVSLMRLISDLHQGRVSPRHFHPGFDIEPVPLDLAQLIRKRFVGAGQLGVTIAEVEPPFLDYRRAQQALVRYIRLADEDDGKQLPVPQRSIRRGDRYPGVPHLARLLKRLGDLPAAVRIPPHSQTYDGHLAEAVVRFQRRHGLDPDGRLGRATLEQLNTPLSRRVEQLRLALERWRWIPRDPPRPMVLVNLPEFRLQAWDDDGTSALSMKVVVGKAYVNETPIVAAEMTQLIFRPSWSVPAYIQASELVPKVRRDREYLARNGYQVVDGSGKVVSSGAVGDDTLKRLRRGGLSIRQTPGAHNSLGLVKFVFPNRYDVYLHGTPARDLLARSRRDFSHGCIRVADPAGLAAWVLRGNPEWTQKRIRAAMRGRGTIPVGLNIHPAVVVFYATAVVLETGEARFFPDLYGLDAALLRVLSAGRPYPRN
jgi:murein L,D-transpeptidase YcbB/YkuD